MTNLVLMVKSYSFPKLPVDKNETNMGIWYDGILSHLGIASLDMNDMSIVYM